MTLAFDLAPAVALLPFASFVIALLVGDRLPRGGALVGIAATAGSLLLSLFIAIAVLNEGGTTEAFQYAWIGGTANAPSISLGILLDPLSALMLIIVSLVSMLVHLFSLGYMNDEGETGLPRYYAGLGLFTFSMLAFVYADNLVMAFMFFELVGLCSYLLIGFWFREDAPPSAAKKAFLVTRFGDYFFLVGVVGILVTFGTTVFAGENSFAVMAEQAIAGETSTPLFLGLGAQTWYTVLGLLVLGGVVGKSAQFPLHTWLPDAMEGPTPVSALIHAATMVAAGVYLIARMYSFYALIPTALAVIALIGGFTALFAATMGVVKREIKQVLAYSTISQYGYMMLALGTGGYVAAVFHLMTHAFFKALLFLGAGSVIIAMHHNENMWDMGGLKDKMPVTYWTFLAGSLALAGIVPFAGFWSKDEVLYEALIHGLGTEGPFGSLMLLAWVFGLLAVFVTGFYTFRMVLLTFHGNPRSETAEHPHAVGWNVKVPLVVLGVLAVVAGFANAKPLGLEFLHHWLAHGPATPLGSDHYSTLLHDVAHLKAATNIPVLGAAAVSLGLALAGSGLAVVLYRGPEPAEHTDRLGSVKTVLYNNYYQDEFQVWLAEGLTLPIARAANLFDQGVVDGVVNGISSGSLFSGRRLRRLQTGVVTTYAMLVILGLIALLVIGWRWF